MARCFKGALAALLLLASLPGFCCTSVIISGAKSPSGRPVMMKHRDTDNPSSRMDWFRGEKYAFIGLTNSDMNPDIPEVWAGTNTAGFCIMNTATYDLRDDSDKTIRMDREGEFMYRALELCANIADFEHYLDTLARPLGVETNFGVIDAHGGAAYYEINNRIWYKLDVNEDPEGWRVVTNFTQNGRIEDRYGVDRYEKARGILLAEEGRPSSGALWRDHTFLINRISRSGAPILRDITTATVVFEGVAPGQNPLQTVLWAAVGWPAATVYMPLMPLCGELIPAYVGGPASQGKVLFSENAARWRKSGTDVSAAVKKTEETVDARFASLYDRWVSGRVSDYHFIQSYSSLLSRIEREYARNFARYE